MTFSFHLLFSFDLFFFVLCMAPTPPPAPQLPTTSTNPPIPTSPARPLPPPSPLSPPPPPPPPPTTTTELSDGWIALIVLFWLGLAFFLFWLICRERKKAEGRDEEGNREREINEERDVEGRDGGGETNIEAKEEGRDVDERESEDANEVIKEVIFCPRETVPFPTD